MGVGVDLDVGIGHGGIDSICTGSPIEICGGPSRNSIYAQPPSMYNTTTSSH